MAGHLRVPGTYVLVLLLEVLLGAGVVAVAVRSDDGSGSAANLLARARRFVGQEQAVRYEGSTTATPLGGFFDTPTRIRGEAQLPDRFHSVQSSGGERVEVLGVGGTRYIRDADAAADAAEGEAELWSEVPERAQPGDAGPPEGLGGPFAVPPELRAFLAVVDHPVFVSPTGLADALDAAEKPVVRDRSDGLTELRAELVAPRLFGSQVGRIDHARIELSVRDDGRIDHVRIFVRADDLDVDVRASYDLRAWGADGVAIEAPPDDEVAEEGEEDDEGLVEPDELAAFDDVPLLMPKGVPEGWTLETATVLEADETVEGCPQAMLVFSDPAGEGGFLEIYQFPLGCSLGPPERTARRFAAGGRVGWVDDDEEVFRFGELYLDGAVFQFSTTLSTTDLETVFGELVPLDLEQLPADLPGVGGSTDSF